MKVIVNLNILLFKNILNMQISLFKNCSHKEVKIDSMFSINYQINLSLLFFFLFPRGEKRGQGVDVTQLSTYLLLNSYLIWSLF